MATDPKPLVNIADGRSRHEAKSSDRRLASLDGLRGVAALAVVLFHVCIPLGVIVSPNGYLAVDFFFLLSGYVLARAYDDRLRGDLSATAFLAIRLARLYPLLLLGIGLGIGVAAIKYAPFPRGSGARAFVETAFANLLILPIGGLPFADDHPLFAFNPPVWSLFWELAVNVIYAAMAPRLGPKALSALILGSAVALIAVAFTHGSLQAGAEAASFGAGAARVGFSFFGGVAIHRLMRRRPRPQRGAISLTVAAAGALGLALFLPMLIDSRLFDPLAVIAVFPAILILALQSEIAGRGRGVMLFVGDISYPLYITHFPIMQMVLVILGGRRPTGAALALLITVEVATMAAVAVLALVFYDRPVQRWLGYRRAAASQGRLA